LIWIPSQLENHLGEWDVLNVLEEEGRGLQLPHPPPISGMTSCEIVREGAAPAHPPPLSGKPDPDCLVVEFKMPKRIPGCEGSKAAWIFHTQYREHRQKQLPIERRETRKQMHDRWHLFPALIMALHWRVRPETTKISLLPAEILRTIAGFVGPPPAKGILIDLSDEVDIVID
jgi:hypothetical protein